MRRVVLACLLAVAGACSKPDPAACSALCERNWKDCQAACGRDDCAKRCLDGRDQCFVACGTRTPEEIQQQRR